MKPLLITGGNGFIGRHLASYLAGRGYGVHATVRRKTESPVCPEYLWNGFDLPQLVEVVETVRPKLFIHLIAEARPTRAVDDLGSQYCNTIVPALTAAKAIPDSVELALFFGSCEEYGDGAVPHVEDQALRAISPYGWAKISAYFGATLTATLRRVPWCWTRPYLAFGPCQHFDRLVPQVITDCLRGAEIVLSPGEQTRDFIFVDDLCAMVERVLAAPDRAAGEVVNLCSGVPRTVKSVAQQIREIVGRGTLGFGKLPYRPNEAMRFYGSAAKFTRLFGSFNPRPFKEAIELTVQSYRQALAVDANRPQWVRAEERSD